MTIASEIAAGLAEAGTATGGAPLILTFTRQSERVNPSDPEMPATTFTLTAVDAGIKDRYIRATGVTLRSRVLLADATGTAPLKSDTVAIRGVEHQIMEIEEVAPGGVPLMFKVHIAA